jgi:TDG/mug DNA glycosylase family protein
VVSVHPTKQDLEAARSKTLPDIIGPDLAILFCGINPGLYSAALGLHFARPGNRFWPALHAAGITPKVLRPDENRRLLDYGCGLTDIVERATARADQLSRIELGEGRHRLEAKVKLFRPRYLAILGIGAFRAAFEFRRAQFGLQPLAIGSTRVWVLPNPSGLNAAHQPKDLAAALRALYRVATARASGVGG